MELQHAKQWVEKKVGMTYMTRGLEYFREGRINIVDISEGELENQSLIKGTCQGAIASPYVVWASTRSNIIEDSFCSCPIGSSGMYSFQLHF